MNEYTYEIWSKKNIFSSTSPHEFNSLEVVKAKDASEALKLAEKNVEDRLFFKTFQHQVRNLKKI